MTPKRTLSLSARFTSSCGSVPSTARNWPRQTPATSSLSSTPSGSSSTQSPATQRRTTLAPTDTVTQCFRTVTCSAQSPQIDRYTRTQAGVSFGQLSTATTAPFLLTEPPVQESLTQCLARMHLGQESSKILFETFTKKSQFAGRRIGKFRFIFHTLRSIMRTFATS
eukprot:XP_001710194.1 Hypothetical protein GL50803_32233 [Giardia lamblia ATCC 50803]